MLSELENLVNKYLLVCGNFAQTSFKALHESFDLEDGGILKALTPLPGIALRGETCGAVITTAVGIVAEIIQRKKGQTY